jgi:pyroglutamyl-peptidase
MWLPSRRDRKEQSAVAKPLILATGFGVFPGAPENPTAWAMAEIERTGWQPAGAQLVTRTLPVRFDLWDGELRPLLASAKPDAVIAFGLSAKARGITLESTARNRVALERPDFTGACASADCVVETGAEVFPTRLPLRDMSEHLQAAGIPIARSDDAGDYLCNLLFYRLMDFAEAGGPRVAGFVHVPYLDTQVARLAAAGHGLEYGGVLTERQLVQAVQIIVECCARALAPQHAVTS